MTKRHLFLYIAVSFLGASALMQLARWFHPALFKPSWVVAIILIGFTAGIFTLLPYEREN